VVGGESEERSGACERAASFRLLRAVTRRRGCGASGTARTSMRTGTILPIGGVGCWRALMETTQRRRPRRYIYTYETGSLVLHARIRCPRAAAPPSASGTHRAASYQSSTSPCKKQLFSQKPALQLLTALTRSNVPVPRRGAR